MRREHEESHPAKLRLQPAEFRERDSPMNMQHWIYLAIAIVAEVIATSALKASDGFSQWLPSVLVVVGYGLAFYFLALTLRSIPVGVAYAIWSGLGIVLVTLIALVLYGQKPDLPAVIGMALIITGVVVMQLFSRTTGH